MTMATSPKESPMKAARVHEYGDADVIRIDDVPIPTPGPGQVLVEVAGAWFDPSDTRFRAGLLQDVFPVHLPYTLGVDISGTITGVGDGVTSWSLGDTVLGMLPPLSGGGQAEYVTAAADQLAAVPMNLPLSAAAAIPASGLAAWQALFEQGHLTGGQRVFINGAGSGVGHLAVQLAKQAGATVITTASSHSAAAAVRALGAEQLIEFTTSLAEAVDEPVDLLINLVPVDPDSTAALLPLIRRDGTIVSATNPVQPPEDSGITGVQLVVHNDPAQLAELVSRVNAGKLNVEPSESHPLSDLADLHRRSEAGQIRGKVIISP
jgi:NADPH:quinone reductase-like Zn-dependent oxidoreductase